MNQFEDAFVIIKEFEGQYGFFTNHISFDKAEIDKKCEELNEEANLIWRKNWESSKRLGEYIPSIIYFVRDLNKAIKEYGDIVAEENTEHDESY